jgi:hypothetical protein
MVWLRWRSVDRDAVLGMIYGPVLTLLWAWVEKC